LIGAHRPGNVSAALASVQPDKTACARQRKFGDGLNSRYISTCLGP
jgi:hypothetical protein